jgi:adenylosuccinate synthase
VGSGPFPTELLDGVGEEIRKAGHEFGSTTGRPRRCGWIDLPTLKYSIMLNGVTQLNMMKADVLDNFDEIKVCTHYRLQSGELTDIVPHQFIEGELTPSYVTLPGWSMDTNKITDFKELPESFTSYIKFLEEQLEVPITLVSVGPDRVSTLRR